MAKVSGVSVELITKFGGISKQLVRKLGSKLTAELGFGPDYNPGPFCNTVTSFYSAVSLWDAYDAGIETIIEQSEDDGKFYKESDCGGDFATTGYYVIGEYDFFYYFWDASAQTLTELEPPSPPPMGPTNTIAPTVNITQPTYIPTYATDSSRGTWTGTGDITYTYEWYVNDNLIATQGPYPVTTYNPKSDTYDTTDIQPSWFFLNQTDVFNTFYLKVTATDDNGSTSVSTNPITIQDATLNTFLTNTGITDSTKISALQYLRKALLTTASLDSTLKDYYPFVGDTENENKWSLKNPNSYLEFSTGWSHSSGGSTPNGSAYATSTYTGVKSANQQLWSLGYYTSTDVQEDSVDISLVQVADYSTTKVAEFGARTPSNQAFFNTPNNVTMNKTLATPSYSSIGLNLVASTDFAYSPDFRVLLNGTVADWTANGRMYGNTLADSQNAPYEKFVLGSRISRLYENIGYQNNPLISTKGSTKQFQFAFVGGSVYTNADALKSIIQTYNSMLGR